MADKLKDITERNHYFDREFLQAEDFILEQEYHIDRRRRHNCFMHTPGIGGDGLQLIESSDREGNKKLKVTPGTAYDKYGREIVVSEAFSNDYVLDASRIKLGKSSYVTIQYYEEPSGEHAFGVSGKTRWSELPIISLTPTISDPDVAICLGQIEHKSRDEYIIHTAERKYAGTKLNNISNLNKSQFDLETQGMLVTGGNSHDHTGGKGAQIKHSSLDMENIVNPHGITAAIIDNTGGSNKIVSQINSGSGIIQKKNVEHVTVDDIDVNAVGNPGAIVNRINKGSAVILKKNLDKFTVDDIDKDSQGNYGAIVTRINSGTAKINEDKIQRATRKGWVRVPGLIYSNNSNTISSPIFGMDIELPAFRNYDIYSAGSNAKGSIAIPIFPGVTKVTRLRMYGYQINSSLTYKLYKGSWAYVDGYANGLSTTPGVHSAVPILAEVVSGTLVPQTPDDYCSFHYYSPALSHSLAEDDYLALYIEVKDTKSGGMSNLFFVAVEFEYGV